MTARRLRFAVRVTPRAGSDRIDGVADGVLRVRVAAAPAEGAANAAVVRLLASVLGVGATRIALLRGVSGRLKLVEIEGLEPEAVTARWPGLGV